VWMLVTLAACTREPVTDSAADSNKDCAKAPECADEGKCTPWPSAAEASTCIVGSDDDCKRSASCRAQGRCSMTQWTARGDRSREYWTGPGDPPPPNVCAPASNEDCLQSEDCKQHGECAMSVTAGLVNSGMAPPSCVSVHQGANIR
jgi:hypothetical protein